MADEETGSASAATGKFDKTAETHGIYTKEVAKQRPPSGRLKGNNNNMNKTSTLKTTQLMFEPSPPPPQQTRKFRRSHNSQNRRIQSAHGRIGTPPQPESNRTLNDIIKQRNKSRPKSAIESAQNKVPVTLTSTSSKTETTAVTPVPKQVLTLDVTLSDCAETSRSPVSGGTCRPSEQTSLNHSHTSREEGKKGTNGRLIPKGIIQLAPWLTEKAPIEFMHQSEHAPFMEDKTFPDMEELPPELPPVQHYDECVIPYTVMPKAPKPFNPKKLFHYDVERHIQEAEALYDRRNIYSVDGRLIHTGKKYGKHRTADIIKQEIDDLEGLLAGIGRADGNSIVVQYQEEINNLQRDVKKTLAQCPKYEEKPEEPPDLMGLRAFIREREEVIGQIKARREACIAELDSMSIEADVGMTMQREIMEAFKNM